MSMDSANTRRLIPPLASHKTKHLARLQYALWPPLASAESPDANQVILLQNVSCGRSTGSTLWLGGQVLSAYLLSNLPGRTIKKARRPCAIEIGAGTGLVSITLSKLGYSVLATDIEPSLTKVLMPNIRGWVTSSNKWCGPMQVCKLDWNGSIDWLSLQSCHQTLNQSQQVLDKVIDLNQSAERQNENNDVEPRIELDLICTSDTIYAPELIEPLLHTLEHLSRTSNRPPLIYLALERRDPTLVEGFFAKAEHMNFKANQISHRSITKLTNEMGWDLEDWEGVEIWKVKKRCGTKRNK